MSVLTHVPRGSGSLAVWDHGPPSGVTAAGRPALVLLHGLGSTHRHLEAVARLLAGQWRVLSMDLRGHGRSTTAPWSFAEAVHDLEAVIAAFGLDHPVVAGHSLGGMVALRYGAAHPDARGVVNIDGWGPGVVERYAGADPERVAAYLADVHAGRLPKGLGRFLVSLSRQGREGTSAAVLEALEGQDIVDWHRACAAPSLAFNAVAPAAGLARLLAGRELAELTSCDREGIRRGLRLLREEAPRVHVVELFATHGLCRTHPREVAAAIEAFGRAL